MNKSVLTPEQKLLVLGDILEEIATNALSLHGMMLELPGELDSQPYLTMANTIGWMADLGLEHTTGRPQVKGDAEDWFMSPRYQENLGTSQNINSK